MSANISEPDAANQNATAAQVPKRITNAQTVCNEKNAKGKLCNGHLKQLRTAGEPAEVHLRGDDVLSKCQTCGTLYMGPPLGHVRDPEKQSRFVEAELTALLRAAGGTMPVIRKDERGIFVMVESAGGHAPAAAKPAAPKPATASPPPTAPAAVSPKPATASPPPIAAPAAVSPKPATASPPTAPAAVSPKPATASPPPTAPAPAAVSPNPAAAAPKPAAPKAGAGPDRKLFRRSNYMGVVDTGPVPGETFEQKVARLKAVSVAAKRRADEGGEAAAPGTVTAAADVTPATPATQTGAPAPVANVEPSESIAPSPAPVAPSTAAHKPTGNADRTLMRRSTYCGVVDTGPVAGESFEQKVERLRAVSAAAKQRSEQGEV